MKKCAEFMGLLFLGRDMAHSVHLNTRSFAKHDALDKFYHEIIDLADAFAEIYQGKYGLIGPITLPSAKKTSNVTDFLAGQMEEIEKIRFEVVSKEFTPLQNVLDEIVGLYAVTLYKLRYLS